MLTWHHACEREGKFINSFKIGDALHVTHTSAIVKRLTVYENGLRVIQPYELAY